MGELTKLSLVASVRVLGVPFGICTDLCSPIPASGPWVQQWAEYSFDLPDSTLMTLELPSLEKFGMSCVLSYDASNTSCARTLLLLTVPRYYCCRLDQTYVRHALMLSPLSWSLMYGNQGVQQL